MENTIVQYNAEKYPNFKEFLWYEQHETELLRHYLGRYLVIKDGKAKQTVMCVVNTSDAAKEIDFSKYAERTNGFEKANNIISNETYNTSDKTNIPAKTIWVLELKK